MELKMKRCATCGEIKPLDDFYKRKDAKYGVRGQCKKCMYQRQKNYYSKHRDKQTNRHKKYYEMVGREKKGHHSMYEDKDSSQWLGIVVGERLCKHLFNDVEMMPHNNPGYDMICNKGMKIDVKTSCIRYHKNETIRWGFTIGYNIIADYFLCVAFDNRTQLNPLYLWLIPSNKVNHKQGITITPSTIHKWDKWKHDINEVQLCCTELKTNESINTPV